jgi:integrase
MMISIPRHFPEKSRNRESQPLSAARPKVLALVRDPTPTTQNAKVTPPRRVTNRERRTREHLIPQEVHKLTNAAGRVGRYGHRDATLIMLAYRHGLRVSELVALRWDQIDLPEGSHHRPIRLSVSILLLPLALASWRLFRPTRGARDAKVTCKPLAGRWARS